jgi:hypothetical protein
MAFGFAAPAARATFPGSPGPLLTANYSVFTFDPATGVRTELTPASLFRPELPTNACGSPSAAQAAPAGDRVVYCEHDPLGGVEQVALMNRDGSGRHLISSTDYIYENPSFDASGTRILSMRVTAEGSSHPTFRNFPNIWSMKLDGSDPVPLTRDSPGANFAPRASPDGERIAFIASVTSGNRLDVIDVDGSHRHTIVDAVATRSFSWSPDGTQIAYTAPGNEAWVVNADGSDNHRLASGSFPVWSPDGARIALMNGSGIVSFDLAGSDPRVLDPELPAALNDWFATPWDVGPYSQVVLADDPIAYWRLGDAGDPPTSMSDATGAHPGTYKNGVRDHGPGVSGDNDHAKAFVGNGTYGYVTGLPAPKSGYSLEAWVRPTDRKAAMIAQQGGAGALLIRGGRFTFRQVDVDVTGGPRVQAGHWYHVVGTWDGALASLYVNGQPVAGAASAKPPSGAATVYLGYGELAPWLRGSLDEVAYYAHALTPDRVADHFHADPPPLRETPPRPSVRRHRGH